MMLLSTSLPANRLRRIVRDATRLATFFAALSISGQTLAQTVPVSLTSIYNFPLADYPNPTPVLPGGALVQLSDGSFYGTAPETRYPASGTVGPGMVYKVTPAGELVAVHIFNRTDGSDPTGLVLGGDGNLYGVTGSPMDEDGNSTVYRMTPAGAVTVLHTFAAGSDGDDPFLLIAGNDGNFYGATRNYFNDPTHYGNGTIFRVTPAGEFTTLYTYPTSDGLSGLAQGSDGNLYVTTSNGGANSAGTVSRLSAAGVLTTLYTFAGGDDGKGPGMLIQGSNGNLYGVTGGTATKYGIPITYGTIFQLTTTGTLTTLHNFTGGGNGAYPDFLTQGNDGNLYGITRGGGNPTTRFGSAGIGTIFQITKAGGFAHLYSFSDGADGAGPSSPLLQSSDGSFYGTTVEGGGPQAMAAKAVAAPFFA